MNNKNLLILLLCFCSFTRAQVLQTKHQKIEFIGLKNNNAQSLLDSITKGDPDNFLRTCVAKLKMKFNFPDASVAYYSDTSSISAVITVVEPNDASRIKYLPNQKDSLINAQEWSQLNNLILAHRNAYPGISQMYGKVSNQNIDSICHQYSNMIDSSIASKYYSTLLSYNKTSDKYLALKIINEDRNFQNRLNAVLVLRNFMKSDSVWCKLVEAMRDKDLRISIRAVSMMIGAVEMNTKTIDWSNAVEHLRYLLNGTNLLTFPMLLEILTKTKISSRLAPSIIKDHHELLIAYLKATNKAEKEIAHNFLKQIAGKDCGYDVVKWQEWIDTL